MQLNCKLGVANPVLKSIEIIFSIWKYDSLHVKQTAKL